MKKDTATVQTAVLPQQSLATKNNVNKLRVFLSKEKKKR